MKTRRFRLNATLFGLVATGLLALPAFAVMPVVKTVPWAASNPLIPHTTYPGKAVRLKGTADQQGANFQYTWDFGDGSTPATGTVSNRYAIEASHTYSGTKDHVWTARLTVTDTNTGEADSRTYYVQMEDKTLAAEANVAIDEGLWYLHKTQRRFTTTGVDLGDWTSCPSGSCYATNGYYGLSAANVNAFEANGHLETGATGNPYTETVARGMRRLFQFLTTSGIGTQTNPLGTFNPDANGNGRGVVVNQGYPFYQGGMFMDAIVASRTPDAVAQTGPAGIVSSTYAQVVQDMADFYAYCQYDGSSGGGGWRYNCNEFPDNSSAQWGAIGLIAAQRNFGATVPAIVKNWNRRWLRYTQNPNGYFGYTDNSYLPWGPYATTPSGMVQMAMDGVGRDTVPPGANDPDWNKAETFIRNNFGNAGSASVNLKAYYYGMFSFTKAMLLHDADGDGDADPITLLRSGTAGVPPIDWYAAEVSRGAPTDGVARTLVRDQNAGGYWYGHDQEGSQYNFETAWAILMLNRTVFASGVPVAVAKALPNPAVAGQTVTLSGTDSYHQDSGRLIDSWEWDLNNDGVWDVSGPFATYSFGALGDYPVTLRVTDDATPEAAATTIVVVRVATPPLAPSANAGGPYSFCPQTSNWFLDGSRSVNPDQGLSEPGRPGDTIQSYLWDLNGDGSFGDASGARPDVTALMQALGVGPHLVQLKVTDTTATSFPSSGMPDLFGTASAVVRVRANDDPACNCVDNLAARAKAGKIQLTWKEASPAVRYGVYRGSTSGGPYGLLGHTTSTYSTFLDTTPVLGSTYHYVVRPMTANFEEICQSNQASATATPR